MEEHFYIENSLSYDCVDKLADTENISPIIIRTELQIYLYVLTIYIV